MINDHDEDSQNQVNSNLNQEIISPFSPKRQQSWGGSYSKIIAVTLIILTLIQSLIQSGSFPYLAKLPLDHSYVILNWKTEPITEIYTSKQGCNEYLINYKFPGTQEGCDCSDSQNPLYQNKLIKAKCTGQQIQDNCKKIYPIQSKVFHYWNIGEEKFEMCVQRATGFNYIKSDCSQKEVKQCGGTLMPFCIPTNYKCPLNSVQYGPNSPNDQGYQVIQKFINGDILFASQYADSNLPLVLGIISEGDGVCKYYKEKDNLTEKRDEYFLLNKFKSGCIEEKDQTFIKNGKFNPNICKSNTNFDSKLSANNPVKSNVFIKGAELMFKNSNPLTDLQYYLQKGNNLEKKVGEIKDKYNAKSMNQLDSNLNNNPQFEIQDDEDYGDANNFNIEKKTNTRIGGGFRIPKPQENKEQQQKNNKMIQNLVGNDSTNNNNI
ncbi:hypothetical protein IMG5_160930 [Ichthyophthirius multifiliis]|uniref:Transmembrane protein n=1 Tax=Ichthyophthirius multifiliis TaxID=5932 RepID=G0R003_ICHMU|nr:hypothetical protein IMG5_160930 [Ichthyophthirius multifiliis]EGR29213.1 hypothetical protein IMG5_160930 [Ichthyophthirius multifiliis]|eukprot:XP_004030449.1 hypothetical protein IMG5_160930 [Ichthyophthirius multifiliis]